MKILIADDDAVIRTLVRRIAAHSSHDIIQAETGREALALVQIADPDLLITDFHMPDMDGLELIDAIRALPQYRRLPIICLSSEDDPVIVAHIIGKGVADYVLKPVRPGELANRIRAVASRERYWKLRLTPPSTAGIPSA